MSEIHIEEHHSPIKTPKQLITVVVLAFLVPITIIVLLTQFITTGIILDPNGTAMMPEYIAQRLKPVGRVMIAAGGGGTQAAKTGEEVVKAVCAACHGTGALGAPKIGDNAAWGKLAAEGLDALQAIAIKGKNSMPPKGGNPALSDLEIARAIVYMANQSGQKLKEPEAKAADKKEGAKPAAGGGAADGKAIFDKTCAACHATGVAGAPKAGDKAAWEPRIKEGKDNLFAHAISGKGAMPPKGGNASLSDDEVKAAVDYMLSLVK